MVGEPMLATPPVPAAPSRLPRSWENWAASGVGWPLPSAVVEEVVPVELVVEVGFWPAVAEVVVAEAAVVLLPVAAEVPVSVAVG